jgi:vitamin-K-epoxide reductase (warfarin-sensitive)
MRGLGNEPGAQGSGSIRLTRMRYLIALLAMAGVVVSILALRVHYDTGTEPCSINEKWDCGIVNHSPYAVIAGIPVAAIGIAGYAALAVLALARRRRLLAVAAIAALGFALYLTHIEKSILQVWCLYCVISQGIIALLTLLSLAWIAAAEGAKRRAQKQT